MRRIEFQPAYILHTRPYQETSLILELFTLDYGRIAVVAKGARRGKSIARGVLQPFIPLLISGMGKGELLTLNNFDVISHSHVLMGRHLIIGFYLNELLMRLMQRWDMHQDLFQIYGKTLIQLAEFHSEEQTLRLFEKALLKAIGYELQLTKEVITGNSVSFDQYYFYDPLKGPLSTCFMSEQIQGRDFLFKGYSLLEIAAENFLEKEVLSDAKRLMRKALAIHLGHKPLESRRLLS